MKSYLIKNKKYTFMFIFFICSFFLFIDKSYAYVLKGYDWTAYTTDNASGSINNNSVATINFPLETPIQLDNNYDFISILFYKLNFKYYLEYDANGYICNTYTIDSAFPGGTGGTGDRYYTQMRCTSTSGSSTDTLNEGTITISARAFDSNNRETLCFFDHNTDMLLCPTVDRTNIAKFQITITQNGYSKVDYSLDLYRQKGWYNHDTTEINNALTQLGTIQQNTTTTIQQFNNYVSDNSTTQAQTNQNTALGGMNTEFGSHLSQMNELTQLTMLPITFINSLLTNTCQPLVWDIPYVNSRVVVPCMSTIYNGYFSALVSTFSLIMTALLGYRAFVKLFNAIKSVVDAEDDKLEVVDL